MTVYDEFAYLYEEPTTMDQEQFTPPPYAMLPDDDGVITVTRRQLQRLGACKSNRERFTAAFGPNARVAVSHENAVKAVMAALDIHWLSSYLLWQPEATRAYALADDRLCAERQRLNDICTNLWHANDLSTDDCEAAYDANRDAYLTALAHTLVDLTYTQYVPAAVQELEANDASEI